MNERQRERLLERIQRGAKRIGMEIPETIEIQGEEFDLKEFVFACKRLEEIPEEKRERIEETKLALKRERLARKYRIRDDDITFEEGERLVRSIGGIDRALNALDGLDEPGVEEQMRRKAIRDARQVMAMVDLKKRL